MPTLNWIGKEKVINHHQDVPYKILEPQYGYTNGVEQPEPNNSGNKIIHGDNLEALKSLLPEYEGKINCIYIDPPYNTGNESWVYNDNVNHPKIKKWLGEVVGKDGEDLTRHDKWLCMMYPRLKLLHKLLSKDGAIFISIDDNEHSHLKLLCDEIFGNSNFIETLIWKKRATAPNDRIIGKNHEYVIVYAKKLSECKLYLQSRSEELNKAYSNPDNDKYGDWRASDLSANGKGGRLAASCIFPIINPDDNSVFNPPEGKCWLYNQEKINTLINDGRIGFRKNTGTPFLKRYLNEVRQGTTLATIVDNAGFSQDSAKENKLIFNDSVFEFPKPSSFIEVLLTTGTNKKAIVLDSFAGSGTTAHAVLNLNKKDGGNRKFILIELMDYANTITAERVKRVIKGYGEDKKVVKGTGGNFNYYELGEPLFLQEDILNEVVGVENILKYIWYSETRTPFTTIPDLAEANYRIGSKDQTDYYFYYLIDGQTTVDYDFMAKIKHKASQYIIYADNCLLEKDFMLKHHIIFKKIPRDITRF
ncbi:MAG: type III restriction endonuclease subunit M [Flavobacteriales bacterium 32-35-8]|nr:MAG: type III restriction endonuclease subunit M [Flavobacteriales bacterium 32-35-8]